MKCIVLAAGYATRLYPLTKNFPKALLKVGNKTILDYLTDDIQNTNKVDEFIIVSNHKFYSHFSDWSKQKPYNISVLDDGTESNETRLGAVLDISFALKEKNINDDILVIAGDNLLDFSLSLFLSYTESKQASCVMRFFEPEEKKLKKCGVLIVNDADLVLNMAEKPEKPESNWCCPPFYFYKLSDLHLIDKAIADGCKTDAPGSLVSYLCNNTKVYAMKMPGNRYDVGDYESYNSICKNYGR